MVENAKGLPSGQLAYAGHFIATQQDRLRFAVMDAFGRIRTVDNRLAIGFVREIASYWQGNVGSAWGYLRVVLYALWIHTPLITRPLGICESLSRRLGAPSTSFRHSFNSSIPR